MTLDPDVVRLRCQEIAQSLQRLDGICAEGRERFLTSRDDQDIACSRLLVSIEAALALCYHTSARLRKTMPAASGTCWSTLL